MSQDVVQEVNALGFPWATSDPFLFCVHHNDAYPAGNPQMGPVGSLSGRRLGMDFGGKDGWSMYHGEVVPGFPRHPHRGFETVTIARRGLIDHSDSLGATARFGHGDVQWMTAGKGVVHAEMFPLVNQDEGNPTELFQIWLNLPRKKKFVTPYFSMLWNHTIPQKTFLDSGGLKTRVTVIAGNLAGAQPPSPPPDSWASDPHAEVAIWAIKMAPGAEWTLPKGSSAELNRCLYFFEGESMGIAGQSLPVNVSIKLRSDADVLLINGDQEAELLMLQGRPIGEPVVKHGPFVMNTEAEIRQAFVDYRRTGFGGWPWTKDDPVHARGKERFAVHAGGRMEEGEPER